MPHYENVPFEVPEGWMWTTLGVIGTWQSGGTPSRSNKSYYGGNIPWLKTGDLNDGYITHIPEFITEEAVVNSSAKLNPVGSVLIAMYGATIGKLGILTFPATTNQACCACIEYDAIDPMFLFYFLLSQRTAFIAKGGGGAQPNISKEIIVKTYIPLPPFLEQQRIVAEIERWFSLIDIIENGKNDLQNIIKQTKNKILDLAIHGKLVSQDPNDEPAIELLKRINPGFTPCDNGHSRKLPQGWAYCQLSNVLKITMGQSPKGDSLNNKRGIEFHQGKICFSDKFLLESGIFTNEPTKIAEPNSILLCVRAPVGVVNITKNQICIGRGLCALTPFEGNVDFYFYLLQTLQDSFDNQSTGTTFKAISGEIIRNENIILPPLAEQQRIVQKIEELFHVFDNIQNALEV
jgi:type I restriction enzyme S subunit